MRVQKVLHCLKAKKGEMKEELKKVSEEKEKSK